MNGWEIACRLIWAANGVIALCSDKPVQKWVFVSACLIIATVPKKIF